MHLPHRCDQKIPGMHLFNKNFHGIVLHPLIIVKKINKRILSLEPKNPSQTNSERNPESPVKNKAPNIHLMRSGILELLRNFQKVHNPGVFRDEGSP